MDTPVDWAPGMSKHMRLKDFPSFIRSTDPDEFMVHYAIRVTGQIAGADAVLLNTFHELEQVALDAMRAVIPPPASINNIGPLALLAEQIVPRGGQLDRWAPTFGRRTSPASAGSTAGSPGPWCS